MISTLTVTIGTLAKIVLCGAIAWVLGKIVKWLLYKPEPYQSKPEQESKRGYMPRGGGYFTRQDLDRLGLGDCHGGCSGVGDRPIMTVEEYKNDLQARTLRKAGGEANRFSERGNRAREWAQRDNGEVPAHGHNRSTGLEVPLDWEIPGALGSERPVEVDTAQWVKVRR